MAEIKISSGLKSRTETSLFTSSNEHLAIYQGTVPTDISDTSTITSRTSDVLIDYTGWSFGGNQLSTSYTTASASGVATWFSIYSGSMGYIVGTIGTTDAFDLILANTTISAGLQYRVTGLNFELPSIITY